MHGKRERWDEIREIGTQSERERERREKRIDETGRDNARRKKNQNSFNCRIDCDQCIDLTKRRNVKCCGSCGAITRKMSFRAR